MNLMKAKLGNEFLLSYDRIGIVEYDAKHKSVKARVIAIVRDHYMYGDVFMLAWNDAALVARNFGSNTDTTAMNAYGQPTEVMFGGPTVYPKGMWLPATFPVGILSVVSSDATAERPCTTCTRKNYLNEKKCWCCGNYPFT